ncbi:MAG: penicillin-binding protein 2 [Methylococcaceae bacterium]|nr:penicillin-binding protein 2 [Methylococcaceae bacterium]
MMQGLKFSQTEQVKPATFAVRRKLLLSLILLAMAALVCRAVFLQIFDTQFLKQQGDRRHIGVVTVPAYRGKIVDRNNVPLAISTPVESVWVNPQHFKAEEKDKFRQIAKLLKLSIKKTDSLLNANDSKRFAYLKRRVNPVLINKIKDLHVKGVYFEREFKRFYPSGAVSAHIVGFTDIDDVGQEGMERAYEQSLKGTTGKKRVIRDGRRRVINDKDIENIKAPIPGQDIVLSIDQRLQYLAFKALQSGYIKHKAFSASIVILDAKNGEILAAASQPAFNPNSRKGLKGHLYRNRAMLDIFEPGSTVKPFVVAAALDGGYIDEDILIETHGFYRVGRNLVKDIHNYGTLDLMHTLKKSSNVAISKIALMMPSEYFWGKYNQLGFGTSANAGFPGESSGELLDFQRWHDFEKATLSYGYGVSTSTLQLARAYTALADEGILHSVSLLKREIDDDAKRVFTKKTANQVREMLEHVLEKDGTAYQARVDGYRIAGKTGTVKKAMAGGYTEDRYLAVFVGLAPASDPRFVIAVMVDEPSTGKYYGGLVAGPIFSKAMAGALRAYGVEPDQEDTMPVLLTEAR